MQYFQALFVLSTIREGMEQVCKFGARRLKCASRCSGDEHAMDHPADKPQLLFGEFLHHLAGTLSKYGRSPTWMAPYPDGGSQSVRRLFDCLTV